MGIERWIDRVKPALRKVRKRLKPLTRPVGRMLERAGVLPSHGPEEVHIAGDLLESLSIRGVMVDVGAHVGSSLAAFLNRGWQVHGFEPDPANRATLVANHGDHPRLRIDPRAISDERNDGVAFYSSGESTGVSALKPFLDSHREVDRVAVITLHEYCAEVGLDPSTIRFLKIDTEGHDLFVLRGFPWSLGAPDAIVCEFEDRKTVPLGYTHRDLAEFLQQHGYSLVVSEWYPVQKYGGQHRWRRFALWPTTLQSDAAWGNFIAVRNPEHFQRLCTRLKL